MGSTEFFRQNKLSPSGTSVAAGVTIDGVSEKGVVEFLQQNEIEQFASDHKRLTAAIFARLRKLDSQNLLQEKEASVDAAIDATQKQLDRLKNHYELSEKLSDSEKEFATQKGIVESFKNADYKRINSELGALNKELLGLKNSKARLEKLIQDVRTLLADYPAYDQSSTVTLNAYEQQARSVIETIKKSIADAAAHQSLQAAETREQELSGKVGALRKELNEFLKARGISEENLSDVGKATERIAQLDEDIASLKGKVEALGSGVGPVHHTARGGSALRRCSGETTLSGQRSFKGTGR